MDINRIWWWGALASLTILPACGGGYDAWASADMSTGGGAYAQAAPAATGYPGGDEGGYASSEDASLREEIANGGATPVRYAQAQEASGSGGQDEPTATDAHEGPLLIYTANLALAVHQVSQRQNEIEELARSSGGHLHHRGDNEITIRVPAGRFQEVLAAVLELGDVLSRDVSVQDVSEEFRDVQTRIRTLEAMYARVQALLRDSHDVEHALAVEQHLERITLELEQARGRLRFLSDRVAFSTITVRFTERSEVVEPQFELPFQWLRNLGLPNLMRIQ
ncbi:MAG: DUF4349 domain-containing protein [Sandaracinaceae bacterium]